MNATPAIQASVGVQAASEASVVGQSISSVKMCAYPIQYYNPYIVIRLNTWNPAIVKSHKVAYMRLSCFEG